MIGCHRAVSHCAREAVGEGRQAGRQAGRWVGVDEKEGSWRGEGWWWWWWWLGNRAVVMMMSWPSWRQLVVCNQLYYRYMHVMSMMEIEGIYICIYMQE